MTNSKDTTNGKNETTNNFLAAKKARPWWMYAGAAILIGAVLILWLHAAGVGSQKWQKAKRDTVAMPNTATSADKASTDSGEIRAPITTVPAGTYVAVEINDAASNYDLATLIALVKMTGTSETRMELALDGSGVATFNAFGDQEAWTYDDEYIYAPGGGKSKYDWDGEKLTANQDGTVVIFVPEAAYVEPQMSEEARLRLNDLLTNGVVEG